MVKEHNSNIDISDIREADTLKEFRQLIVEYEENAKSGRAATREATIKQQIVVRKIIIKMGKSKKFKEKITAQTKGISRADAGLYYAIIQLLLFPQIKKGKKSKLILKKLNLYNKVQEAAADAPWEPEDLVVQCQQKGGIRGVAKRYTEKCKEVEKTQIKKTKNAKDKKAGKIKGLITFKKLPGAYIKFKESVRGEHKLILAKITGDGMKGKKLIDLRGSRSEKFIADYFNQITKE